MTNTLPAPRTLTANVTRVFRQATETQRSAGFDWYSDAHATAKEFAVTYGVSPAITAGIIAALSPINSWGANVKLARRMLASKGTLDHGYLGDGLRKARRIYAGEDILSVLTSDKVRNFYLSIVSNGVDGVTVDRHAYSVAMGERIIDVPKLSHKRYEELADAYRRAAKIISREEGVSVSAGQVQAITWVSWRDRYWSEGAFDGTAE